MKRILLAIIILLAGLQAVSGQEIPVLKPLKNLDEDLVPAQKKEKWGYANAKGKIIIKAVFDAAEEFMPVTSEDGTTMLVARIKVGDKWGYITRENVYLFEPEYDTISRFDNSSVVVAKLGPNLSLLGVRSAPSQKLDLTVLTGNILQVNLSEIREFSDQGIAWAARAGHWGMMNIKGKWILPCEYDSWAPVRGKDLYAIGRDGKTGMCTLDGQVLIPATYDSILPLEDGSFVVSANGQSGVLGNDGSVVIEPQFQSVAWDGNLGFVVSNDGQFGRYDASGKEIYPCIFKAIPDTGLRGYEEMVRDGVPSIYLAGKKLMTVKEYDDELYSQLNAEEYAANAVVPDWLKSHLSSDGKYVILEDRMPSKKDIPEEFDGSAAQCAEIHFKCGVSLADIVAVEEDGFVYPMAMWDAGSKVYVQLHGVEEFSDLYIFDAKTRNTVTYGIRGNFVCDPEAGFIAETGFWSNPEDPLSHLTPMCFPESAKSVTMPIIRYRFRTWAGEAFVFAGESIKGESGLKPVKAGSEIVVGQIMYGESDQYCDFSMRIRSAAANGIALYELVATEHVYAADDSGELVTKTPRVVAYGYIGLGLPFFTQPIFYEARDFSEDKAAVRIGDEWLSLDAAGISQMDPFIQPD